MENAGGQMVTFYLGKELFGIELEYVREIIRLPEMVRVPGTPHYFSGLANLRGNILPVIDGRKRFNIPDVVETDATRVVVLEYRGETIGYIVDRMSEVINLENATEDTLCAARGREELISRVIKSDDGSTMVMVINIEVLFPRLEGAGSAHYSGAAVLEKQNEAAGQEELKQFVGFRLAEEEYAVAIETVQEIVRVPDRISRSPGFPHYMDGLFSLRRRTVPMLNLRRFFDLPDRPYDDRARVLVLNLGVNEKKMVVGLGVDSITEVLRFTAEEIEPLPELLRGDDTKNLTGVCKLGEGKRLIYLLDPHSILSEGEINLDGSGDEETEAGPERRVVSEEQFVIFHLQEEEYAVNIQSVKEIIRPPEIVRVPRAPAYVEGVINIRGTILPVINLRLKLSLPARENDDRSRIVVVDMNGVPTGLVVDAVREVRKIAADQIAPVPAVLGAHLDTGYLQGVVRSADSQRSILLLKLQSVLTGAEQMEVAQVAAEFTGGVEENEQEDAGADR
ncbi:MAG: chemotaxis protein CheW [Bacillota bacterium]|uniref:chemotaxis protein CheW n=1 Tax=Desulfurispora thermophila TaxID=265470 RepID=UPI0003634865|nr:chemotaxis protein CheW [Desulfurispora thermophila]